MSNKYDYAQESQLCAFIEKGLSIIALCSTPFLFLFFLVYIAPELMKWSAGL